MAPSGEGCVCVCLLSGKGQLQDIRRSLVELRVERMHLLSRFRRARRALQRVEPLAELARVIDPDRLDLQTAVTPLCCIGQSLLPCSVGSDCLVNRSSVPCRSTAAALRHERGNKQRCGVAG
jgi:hypothetical protein